MYSKTSSTCTTNKKSVNTSYQGQYDDDGLVFYPDQRFFFTAYYTIREIHL